MDIQGRISGDADAMIRATRTSRGRFITKAAVESAGSLNDKEHLRNRISFSTKHPVTYKNLRISERTQNIRPTQMLAMANSISPLDVPSSPVAIIFSIPSRNATMTCGGRSVVE